MAPSVDHFSRCILAVYDAATNPGRWRHALDAVIDMTDAQAMMLLVRRPAGFSRDLNILSSNYLTFSRSMLGRYYTVRYSRLQNPDWQFLSRCDPHAAVWDVDAGFDEAELDRRGDYAFLREHLNVGRRLGVRLNQDRLWFDAISLAMEAGSEAPERASARVLAPVLPHLTKATEMTRVFLELKRRYAAVLTAIDHVHIAMFVVGSSAEIIVENALARIVLDAADGLIRTREGALACREPERTAELAEAIMGACATSRGEKARAEYTMALPRQGGGSHYLVDIAPLRDGSAELSEPLVGALVSVIDPDRLPEVRMKRFAKAYGLTAAESEVCALAFSGLTLNEIAERRSTSAVTAKNQMARILEKTDTHRRSELVRLILKVHPPVA